MRSQIKRVHSPDCVDLAAFRPSPEDDFKLLVQVLVGPAGVDAEESFDVVVASSRALARELGAHAAVVGRHWLFLKRFDFVQLEAVLREMFEIEGDDWPAIANVLARFGRWEFEDYRESASNVEDD